MGQTSGAIAYLKGKVAPSVPAEVTLSHEDSPVFLDFAGDLLVSYAVDEGSWYRLVQQRDLERDGLSAEDLHPSGLEDLLNLAAERGVRVQPSGAIFAVLMGGDFEASLLLLDSLWEQSFRQFVPGDYVAVAPARDILAFCDSSSAAGIEELRQVIARTYPSCDHLLSDKLYLRRNGAWGLAPPVA
jgi:uncharacterized protein YtpQ (UPF0354 family)